MKQSPRNTVLSPLGKTDVPSKSDTSKVGKSFYVSRTKNSEDLETYSYFGRVSRKAAEGFSNIWCGFLLSSGLQGA